MFVAFRTARYALYETSANVIHTIQNKLFGRLISHRSLRQITFQPRFTIPAQTYNGTPLAQHIKSSSFPHYHSLSHRRFSTNAEQTHSTQETHKKQESSGGQQTEGGKTFFEQIIQFLIMSSGLGGGGVLLGLFILLYKNAPDENWPTRIKQFLDVIKNYRHDVEELKSLKIAQNLVDRLDQVVKIIKIENISDPEHFLRRMIEEAQKKHKEEVDGLTKKMADLNIIIKGHETTITDLDQARKDLTAAQEALKEEKDLHKATKDLLETATTELGKTRGELTDSNRQLEKTRADLKEATNKLGGHKYRYDTIMKLSKRCPDEKSFNHFIAFAFGKGVKFDANTQFDRSFIEVMRDALKADFVESVTELNFYGTYLGGSSGHVRHLMEGLKNNKTIKKVDLGYAYVDSKDADSIAEMLKSNKALQHLNLYYSYLTDGDVQKLYDALASNSERKLESLVLNRNKCDINRWMPTFQRLGVKITWGPFDNYQ